MLVFGGVGFFFSKQLFGRKQCFNPKRFDMDVGVGRELPKNFGEFVRRKNATLGVPMSKNHVFFAPKNIFWNLGFEVYRILVDIP